MQISAYLSRLQEAIKGKKGVYPSQSLYVREIPSLSSLRYQTGKRSHQSAPCRFGVKLDGFRLFSAYLYLLPESHYVPIFQSRPYAGRASHLRGWRRQYPVRPYKNQGHHPSHGWNQKQISHRVHPYVCQKNISVFDLRLQIFLPNFDAAGFLDKITLPRIAPTTANPPFGMICSSVNSTRIFFLMATPPINISTILP